MEDMGEAINGDTRQAEKHTHRYSVEKESEFRGIGVGFQLEKQIF